MVTIQDESISYNGRVVLRDVSLTIRPKERVALVGRSGAGKSTLLKLLYQRQISGAALVPQDAALVKTLTVYHNVYMGRLDRHGTFYNLLNLAWPQHREVEAVKDVLIKFRLDDKIFTPAGELSGGQQQRTAVARAIYQGGDMLLGDEPVSAVDEHQGRAVLEAINESYDTVILAMHDVKLALAYTDRVIGLKDGEILFDMPTAGLKTSDIDHVYTG
ncbi:MAG: ATP-binding cassette domain-containing protein [Alphaproteobacteria bacterium]